MMNRKKLSVIVPSINGIPFVKECLESIYKQSNSDLAEIIIVDSSNEETRNVIKDNFKDVILICPSEKKTVPELRSIGIKEAKNDIIAMIEDHCLVPDNWFTAILKAHESDYIAIGGAVENVCKERILDWATFFCEYSAFIQPVPSGAVYDLPGNNVSYKRREVMQILGDSIDKGVWEGFLHQKLIENGYTLFSSPSVVVYHKKPFALFEFLSQRFYYSRSFAGMRIKDFSFLKRIIYSILCILLPGLIIFRLCARIIPKNRLRKEFALSMPFLTIFALVWALGECCGYIFGKGNSLQYIK